MEWFFPVRLLRKAGEKETTCLDSPSQAKAEIRNKNWKYTESSVVWGKYLMPWNGSIWAEGGPGLILKCPVHVRCPKVKMSLGLLSSPSQNLKRRRMQKQGATRQRGCTFSFSCQMLLTFSGTGTGCAQAKKLLKHWSNFKPGMDNHICPSNHSLTYFIFEFQPLKSLDLVLL